MVKIVVLQDFGLEFLAKTKPLRPLTPSTAVRWQQSYRNRGYCRSFGLLSAYIEILQIGVVTS